jgi:hypothetical protein
MTETGMTSLPDVGPMFRDELDTVQLASDFGDLVDAVEKSFSRNGIPDAELMPRLNAAYARLLNFACPCHNSRAEHTEAQCDALDAALGLDR